MGRPRTPTILKELADNPGKHPLNKNEPKPKGSPKAPKEMGVAAKRIWNRLVVFMPKGVWTPLEEGQLSAYCNAQATEEECARILNNSPMLVAGSQGQMVPHPLLRVRSDAARLMIQLSSKLGLDPHSRQALQVPDDSEEDEEFDIH